MNYASFLIVLALFLAISTLAEAATCKNRLADGSTCTGTEQCLATSYCHYEKKICTPMPGNNQPCGDGVYCSNNLGCSTDTGLCQSLPAAGSKCLLGERGPFLCASGFVCYSGVCDSLKTNSGAPCSDFTHLCGTGLGCDFSTPDSVCTPSKTFGQACAANTPSICAAGLYCSVYTAKCEYLLKEGSSCKDPVQCAPGLSCIPQTLLYFFKSLKCSKIPSTVGSPCTDVCAGQLTCTG